MFCFFGKVRAGEVEYCVFPISLVCAVPYIVTEFFQIFYHEHLTVSDTEGHLKSLLRCGNPCLKLQFPAVPVSVPAVFPDSLGAERIQHKPAFCIRCVCNLIVLQVQFQCIHGSGGILAYGFLPAAVKAIISPGALRASAAGIYNLCARKTDDLRDLRIPVRHGCKKLAESFSVLPVKSRPYFRDLHRALPEKPSPIFQRVRREPDSVPDLCDIKIPVMLQVDDTELILLCLFLFRTVLPRLPEKRVSAVLLFLALPLFFFSLTPLFFLPARIRQAARFLLQSSALFSSRFLCGFLLRFRPFLFLFPGSFLCCRALSGFLQLLFLDLTLLLYFFSLFPGEAPAFFLLVLFLLLLFLPFFLVFYHVEQCRHMCAELPPFCHRAVTFSPFRPAILHRYGYLMPLVSQYSCSVFFPVCL